MAFLRERNISIINVGGARPDAADGSDGAVQRGGGGEGEEVVIS